MTTFSDHNLVSQHGHSTERQIRELQHAIQENYRKLVEVQQKRLRVEEEIIQCNRETKQRVVLMTEKGEVVDALLRLGHLLQEEKQLSEQLNGQSSADRNQRNDLQDKSEHIANKARSLAAEILEVKVHLAEAQARNRAAQALIPAPTGKSKRNQSKPK